MISILCGTGTQDAGETVARALQTQYSLTLTPPVHGGESPYAREAEWDDLLLVVYGPQGISASARAHLEAFQRAHLVQDQETGARQPGGFIVPVATDRIARQPPDPIARIKAVVFDGAVGSLEGVVRAVGVLLGLAVRSSDHRIFVAYRATDGIVIATDLANRLRATRFHPWLDEADENLAPGDEVQRKIHANIATAAMLLLVDTPNAPASWWIGEEIETAIGMLIPVLPVVTGPKADISRFPPLSSLQRRAVVKPQGPDGQPLSDAEWEVVLRQIEDLLLDAYRRRLRILAMAEQTFIKHGFDWSPVDPPKRMFQSYRKEGGIATRVLSHCSVHDANYQPAHQAYSAFIKRYKGAPDLNQKLCIYDRDMVLSDYEIDFLSRNLDPSFILAHYSELGVLVQSNFARLR